MMMIVHATVACAEPVRQQIQHLWLLDIATTGFTMLAGYTVGMRYSGAGRWPQRSRLFIRALQLLVVMFYSNLILQLGKLFLEDQFARTVSLSWLIGLFTLETSYNISGVLLPIALLLPLLPLLYSSERQFGNHIYLVWFTIIITLVVIGRQFASAPLGATKVYQLLWVDGLGGFAVLPFIGYGIIGFITARIFAQQSLTGTASLGVLVLIGLGLGALSPHQDLAGASAILSKGLQVLRSYSIAEFLFLGTLTVGLLLTLLPYVKMASSVSRPLIMVGQYGLFAFVIHRMFGHFLVWILGLKDGGYGIFLFMFVSTAGLTYLACVARMRWEAVDQVLIRLYL
jgi:hypothetical protein